ncbi:hypothetical protein LCGC14_0600750 [marine sediment metagenome]|uniref:Uncharacterized protein n=1 Tax=marine sediment metagenome TaxID=412755 RepID=A0A0F9RFA2_9ZZZZ
MGRLPSNVRHYDLQILQERHKEILRRLALGESREQVAIMLGITPAVVSYTANSSLGKAQLAVLQNGRDDTVKEISEQIKDLLPRAIEVMDGALHGKIDLDEGANVTIGQSIKAAQDILGRGGHVAPTRVQGHHLHEHKLTADDITKIKERAAAAAQVNGNLAKAEVIDAEVIEPLRLEDGNAEGSNTIRSPEPDISGSGN